MHTLIRTLILCLAVTALAAPALAAERPTVSVTHELGTVAVPLKPERVVILDYGSLDTLMVLGLEPDLALPKGNLPAYLKDAVKDEHTDIGGLREFNLETINAFKPELIIISGRQQEYYKELSAIAPVLVTNNLASDYLASSKKNIDILGQIFDVRDQVEEHWNAIDAAAAKVREQAADKNLKALVLLTNDGKISAYGSGSRFGIIHDELGVPEADPSIKVGIHGQLVNYEYIAMTNPDIIFVVDRSAVVRGKADGVKLLENALVDKTSAARNNRIVALESDIWYLSGGGLQSLRRMIEAIGAAIGS